MTHDRATDRQGSTMRKHRSLAIERLTGRLPALALAGTLCLVVTSPALADFESAVAAYENGAY